MGECEMPVQFAFGQNYPHATRASRASSVEESRGGDLVKIAVPWQSPVPLTAAQLEKKQSEFWETAPAYGGSMEVWQALRNAVDIGPSDMETARMILDCAGVTTPNGTLTEAYDDHGYRYSIPAYCLCDPSNGLTESELEKQPVSNDNIPILDDGLSTFKLKIRISTGDDLVLELPSSPKLCIGHVRVALKKAVKVEKRLDFFWAGHGPLSDNFSLGSLGNLSDPSKPMLQAWIFP
jgi:hypothetical protein